MDEGTSPLVTIILPIYNDARVVNACIESILNQTYSNLQIILINDGSCDDTDSICLLFSFLDCRIEVIGKMNSGVSATRNSAISIAKGKYLCFIDSDDVVSEHYVEKMLEKMETCDMVSCSFWQISNDNTYKIDTNIIDLELKKCSSDEIKSLFNSDIMRFSWNKLFKREFIQKYHLGFDEQAKIGEDHLFNFQYIYYCKKIGFVHEPLYNYNVFRGKGSRNFYLVNTRIKKFLTKKKIYELLFDKQKTDIYCAESALREIRDIIEMYCSEKYKKYGENPKLFWDFFSPYVEPFLQTDIFDDEKKRWINKNWRVLSILNIDVYIFIKKLKIYWRKIWTI